MSDVGGDNAPRSRPVVSHVGRSATPSNNNNDEENPVPDFQYFGLTPRSPPSLQGFLEVWGVEVHARPDDVNKTQHHTQFYDCNNLVVRRGQPFQITITINRPYKAQTDKLWVELFIGRHPSAVKGTYIPIYLQDELVKGRWGAKVITAPGNILGLSVLSPADCIVGRFRMYVAIMTPHGIRRTARDKATDIYFIFNPWCNDDAVYLSDDDQRHEYVMNDVGCIYYGTSTEVTSRPWIYGQFERNVLNACIYILDRARMPLQSRGCPIKVCRVASAMINSKDDAGVLVGCWDGTYVDGVAPTAWNSSVEILLLYYKNKQPVCYGQCWVFAAVLNTVLRCLGLPTRVVTNYSSAHDNDANLHTDIILDQDGKKMLELTKDSIWNYHCWNESWMLRADLPSLYGGWQAVDATPQETSEGMYQCGPASVTAIKEGQVCFPFDAPFVYAEVNRDVVYLNDDDQRHEYVMNDVGCIYYGTSTEVTSRPWIYGQFERNVLNACIYILDRARMPLQSRGCPIKVCRVASAMINSKDDAGVLVGCWDGTYVDGVAPTAWNSSVEILLLYYKNKQPVCYGQCWVFAAVLNTVLRCLGLPTRVVTNYSSAHDNDANLHTDIILDQDGKKMLELTKDSIWNYHCWNESWMLRADLPSLYGGWQAVDATPQETSEGMYQCGPASVIAIKEGQVCFPFDAPFVYAEVNSDVVYWTQQNDGSLVKGEVKTDEVGLLILTKQVGSDMRMNITDLYKYPEGSPEERLSLATAVQLGVVKPEAPMDLPKDVSIKVQVDENIMVGSNFTLALEFNNHSNENRSAEVQITGYVVFYTGVPKVQMTDENIEVEMEPNEVQQAQVVIKAKDYEDKLVEQLSLQFLITATVPETEQRLVIEKKVTLQIPKLRISVEGEVAYGREVSVVVQFTNPFTKPLEHLVLRIDGLDYAKSDLMLFSRLPENETLKANFSVVLRRHGRWKIIGSLDCPALRQVGGELELQVQ
ncbi:coagulation factor XIII A chain [Amblyraja radiata]|uniref:coagulation factor XIII A chain n=1 Tax=Amblyraja radiata TaxID=386614 RepID=UPI001403AAE4|nr:coagulation factor XIII A chain [Amblyraja radiata]